MMNENEEIIRVEEEVNPYYEIIKWISIIVVVIAIVLPIVKTSLFSKFPPIMKIWDILYFTFSVMYTYYT